jgi:hypothetical protein
MTGIKVNIRNKSDCGGFKVLQKDKHEKNACFFSNTDPRSSIKNSEFG